jgi:DNA-binding GntR family transcriptional regulator
MATAKRSRLTKARRKSGPAAALPRRPRAGSTAAGEVYERIWNAIMDHSLPPATRLVEERLCEIFGLGRTRLRQVLQRLAHERVVTLMPNRGAMVAKPSVREAREVFAARRVIEAGTVAGFIESATRTDCQRLAEHLLREQAAWRDHDRRAMIILSGKFHLIIAESAGNRILAELLRDLISRSSLIIAVYRLPGTPSCPPHEHRRLLDALEQRERSAVDLMVRHLDHVAGELRLEEASDQRVDLRSVLTPEARGAL